MQLHTKLPHLDVQPRGHDARGVGVGVGAGVERPLDTVRPNMAADVAVTARSALETVAPAQFKKFPTHSTSVLAVIFRVAGSS